MTTRPSNVCRTCEGEGIRGLQGLLATCLDLQAEQRSQCPDCDGSDLAVLTRLHNRLPDDERGRQPMRRWQYERAGLDSFFHAGTIECEIIAAGGIKLPEPAWVPETVEELLAIELETT